MTQPNDAFASRTVLTTGTPGRLVGEDNTGCGQEVGEPHAGISLTLHSLWYEWVATYDGYCPIMVKGTYPPYSYVYVYTGSTLATLTEVFNITTGVAGSLAFPCTNGTSYKIQVATLGDDGTPLVFDIVWDERVYWERAEVVSFTDSGSLVFAPYNLALLQNTEPFPYPYRPNLVHYGIWLKFVPDIDIIKRLRVVVTGFSIPESVDLQIWEVGMDTATLDYVGMPVDDPAIFPAVSAYPVSHPVMGNFNLMTTTPGSGLFPQFYVDHGDFGVAPDMSVGFLQDNVYHILLDMGGRYGAPGSVIDLDATYTLYWDTLINSEATPLEVTWSIPPPPIEGYVDGVHEEDSAQPLGGLLPLDMTLTGLFDGGRRWFS